MFTEMLSQSNAQLEQAMQPARKLQSAMVNHVAKVTDFQMEALKGYSELGLDDLRALQQVQDGNSLQAYVSRHAELMKTISEKMSGDMQTLMQLQRSFGEEVQKLTQEGVEKAGETARKQASQAATTVKKSA
ncbi:MAG: phasin family protein [Ectothiorhodospiraceae bacterium]|nr:phasin family protein [Ectothiorhodospiraceae bacterium]MCH8505535.1 phasin family protein [Ectothiorhodospiraceae bacterium]